MNRLPKPTQEWLLLTDPLKGGKEKAKKSRNDMEDKESTSEPLTFKRSIPKQN